MTHETKMEQTKLNISQFYAARIFRSAYREKDKHLSPNRRVELHFQNHVHFNPCCFDELSYFLRPRSENVPSFWQTDKQNHTGNQQEPAGGKWLVSVWPLGSDWACLWSLTWFLSWHKNRKTLVSSRQWASHCDFPKLNLTLWFVLRLRSEKWMDVQVGDIIKLENNQFVTVSKPFISYLAL